MTERTERCETCKWWEDSDNKWTPRCKRFPPQINAVRVAEIVNELNDGEHAAAPVQCWEYPPTMPYDFCGEWTSSFPSPMIPCGTGTRNEE